MKSLRTSYVRLLVPGLLAASFAPVAARAFDSGHHWELTAQALNEAGFSEDARQNSLHVPDLSGTVTRKPHLEA